MKTRTQPVTSTEDRRVFNEKLSRWQNLRSRRRDTERRRKARGSRGVRGHAPPENFENLGLLECISRILGCE